MGVNILNSHKITWNEENGGTLLLSFYYVYNYNYLCSECAYVPMFISIQLSSYKNLSTFEWVSCPHFLLLCSTTIGWYRGASPLLCTTLSAASWTTARPVVLNCHFSAFKSTGLENVLKNLELITRVAYWLVMESASFMARLRNNDSALFMGRKLNGVIWTNIKKIIFLL